MRILFVAVDSQFIHSNLALRYLLSLSRQFECCADLMETTVNDEVDGALRDLAEHDPELVVFSCYIWNITYIEKLISALKLILPETLIACGGPEVAWSAEQFMARCPCDFVMAGEGEAVFPPLLKRLLEHRNDPEGFMSGILSHCPGLYIRQGEGLCFTGPAPLMNMADVPFPYDSAQLECLKDRVVYYEGQRGCPYGCSYCLSSVERALRHKPPAMVKRELKVFMTAKVPLVKFTDRSFNVREEWAYEILNFIREETDRHGQATSFHFEVNAACLSQRLIALFEGSPPGLFQIEAGIQSTDTQVLRLIRRHDDPERLTTNLARIISSGGVHVHTDLIAGLPGDSKDSFRQSFNDAMGLRPQLLQVGFLKVLQGTPLAEEKQRWGILHRPWPPYEVLATNSLSYRDLQHIKGIATATDKYYNSGKFSNSMRFLLAIWREPWDLFDQIFRLLADGKVGRQVFNKEKYYSLILDLSNSLSPADAEILAELVRFDWILDNPSGCIPVHLMNEKYNSRRGRLRCAGAENSLLKGNVTGFTIDVMSFRLTGTVVRRETFIFYSLSVPEPISVLPDPKGEYWAV